MGLKVTIEEQDVDTEDLSDADQYNWNDWLMGDIGRWIFTQSNGRYEPILLDSCDAIIRIRVQEVPDTF